MLQTLYRGLTELGGPAIRFYLSRRLAAGKEDVDRRAERLGIASCPRPPGRLVWFHAASVGEALSILVLVDRLRGRAPDLGVLVTTGTVTSASLMARRLPPGAIHQYVPVDRLSYVRRFLDHWRPDLALWTESEIWPNLLCEIGRRGIPAALVNARMSVRSYERWRRFPGFIAPLLATFRLCLAQTATEAERLATLGAPRVACVGNLKFSAAPLPAEPAALAALTTAIGGRPVWMLASSHPGEEEIALGVHRRLAPSIAGLLTLMAPRHPHRGPAIAELVRAQGLAVSRRAAGTLPAAGEAVHVADTVGDMGVLFRVAPVVCIGKSLAARGGHNPIEPAQLGCAVLYGPAMGNFAEVAAELEAAGAARTVADGAALGEAVGGLLSDVGARQRMAAAALAFTERNRHVVDDALDALAPLFADAGILVAA